MNSETNNILDITQLINAKGLLYSIMLLIIVWFLVRFITSVFLKLGQNFTGKRLLFNQLTTVTRFIIYCIAIMAAISLSINLSKEVVLALTGSIAVTIGFAMKDIAASIIAGIIIIFDRPFQVGDRVRFADNYGEIVSIGLRSVRLMTVEQNMVTIPNSKFLTEVVSSSNWGALAMMLQMDFFIGVDQDISRAKQIVEECLIANRYVYLQKPWSVLVNQVFAGNYYSVRLRLKAHVIDVKYEQDFEADVTERVLESFNKHNIKPPAMLNRNLESAGFF